MKTETCRDMDKITRDWIGFYKKKKLFGYWLLYYLRLLIVIILNFLGCVCVLTVSTYIFVVITLANSFKFLKTLSR